MVRELNMDVIDDANKAAEIVPRGYRRRRETNPTVQMSVRMKEDVYEKFRLLCERERRTNGDMMEVLMNAYLEAEEKAAR